MVHVPMRNEAIGYATTQKLPKLKFELCIDNEKQ